MTVYDDYLYESFMEMALRSIEHQNAKYVKEHSYPHAEVIVENANHTILRKTGYNLSTYQDMLEGAIVPNLITFIRFPLAYYMRFEDFYDLGSLTYRRKRRVRKRFRVDPNLEIEDQIREYFPRRLIFLSDYLGYSREEFHDMHWTLKMTIGEWRDMLEGVRLPNVQRLCRMAQELEVSIETLLGLDEWVYFWEIRHTRKIQGI